MGEPSHVGTSWNRALGPPRGLLGSRLSEEKASLLRLVTTSWPRQGYPNFTAPGLESRPGVRWVQAATSTALCGETESPRALASATAQDHKAHSHHHQPAGPTRGGHGPIGCVCALVNTRASGAHLAWESAMLKGHNPCNPDADRRHGRVIRGAGPGTAPPPVVPKAPGILLC